MNWNGMNIKAEIRYAAGNDAAVEVGTVKGSELQYAGWESSGLP